MELWLGTDRQTDRKIDRQTDGQTDTQIDGKMKKGSLWVYFFSLVPTICCVKHDLVNIFWRWQNTYFDAVIPIMALYKRHEIEENTILNNIIKENYNKKILSSNHKIFSIGLNYHMTVQTSHILFSKFSSFSQFSATIQSPSQSQIHAIFHQ